MPTQPRDNGQPLLERYRAARSRYTEAIRTWVAEALGAMPDDDEVLTAAADMLEVQGEVMRLVRGVVAGHDDQLVADCVTTAAEQAALHRLRQLAADLGYREPDGSPRVDASIAYLILRVLPLVLAGEYGRPGFGTGPHDAFMLQRVGDDPEIRDELAARLGRPTKEIGASVREARRKAKRVDP